MQTEQLRAFLLEYLKSVEDSRDQNLTYTSCVNGITQLAQKRYPKELDHIGDGLCLRDHDKSRIKHVIWDLILNRVLTPGIADPQTARDGWPFLSLTDHGRKVVSSQQPTPYDPDGYLARLNDSRGSLHRTVRLYIEESLSTFRTGNHLASAVMLGAASEMIFIKLSKAISEAFADVAEKEKFDKRTGDRKHMSDRVKVVKEWLSQKKTQLPPDWQNPERVQLINSIACLIRRRRNETGHPQDPPAVLSHEEMYALLTVFANYCKTLYELMNWLNDQQEKIA